MIVRRNGRVLVREIAGDFLSNTEVDSHGEIELSHDVGDDDGRDVDSGLYDFRHRNYSPTLGRWVQQDPIGYDDGSNLYQVVQSRPITFVDPLGLDSYGQVGGNAPVVSGPAVVGADGTVSAYGPGYALPGDRDAWFPRGPEPTLDDIFDQEWGTPTIESQLLGQVPWHAQLEFGFWAAFGLADLQRQDAGTTQYLECVEQCMKDLEPGARAARALQAGVFLGSRFGPSAPPYLQRLEDAWRAAGWADDGVMLTSKFGVTWQALGKLSGGALAMIGVYELATQAYCFASCEDSEC